MKRKDIFGGKSFLYILASLFILTLIVVISIWKHGEYINYLNTEICPNIAEGFDKKNYTFVPKVQLATTGSYTHGRCKFKMAKEFSINDAELFTVEAEVTKTKKVGDVTFTKVEEGNFSLIKEGMLIYFKSNQKDLDETIVKDFMINFANYIETKRLFDYWTYSLPWNY